MKSICEYAREWKQEGKKSILDVNCKTGEDAICFVNAGFWVTASDPQEKHVSYLRQWEKESGKILRSKQCGITPLPFAENAFDCIWAKNLFTDEMKQSFEEVLDEIRRVLKPDGILAVWIPALIFGKAKLYKEQDEEKLNEKMYDFVFQESIWSEEGVWVTAVLQKEEKKPDYTEVLGRKVKGKSMSFIVKIKKQLALYELSVDLETEAGILAVIGGSGSGKSMTLKCIAGIETPDSGFISLNGRVLYDSSKKINLPPQKRNVGYLFQEYALFPTMTAAENISIVMKQKNPVQVQKWLEEYGLGDYADSYPDHLSGGQKQRLAMIRMLAAEPQCILLDEPFSALDEHIKRKMEREVMEMLHDFDKPILFVSHNQEEVYRLADRIASMENGRFSPIREKRAFFAEPQTVGQAKLVGCNNISEIDWISEDRVYAKDWNLSLRVPFTELEEQKKYRAIAIYPGDITLYSEDAILEEKQVRNKISVKSCSTEEELHSWAVSCQIDGTDAELMMLLSKEKMPSVPEKITEIFVDGGKIHLLQ